MELDHSLPTPSATDVDVFFADGDDLSSSSQQSRQHQYFRGETMDDITRTLHQYLHTLHEEAIHGVEIGDTVLLVEGNCRGLYWYDRGRHTVEYDPHWPRGEVQQEKLFSTKRAAEGVVREEMLIRHFTGECYEEGKMCAIFVSMAGDGKVKSRYMCSDGVSRFLRHLGPSDSGLLMRYIPPAEGHHNLIRVLYTPFVTKVEKHRVMVPLSDRSVSLAIRTSTSRQSGCAEVSPVTDELHAAIDSACQAVAEGHRRIGVEVQQSTLYFLHVDGGRVVFLWCSAFETKSLKATEGFEQRNAPVSPGGRRVRPSKGFARSTAAARRGTTVIFPAASTESEVKAKKCPPTPPPSPLSGAQSMDQTIALYDGIQHFGFWGEEPRKVRNSLKKQIQTLTYVSDPPSMVLQEEPPYPEEFIEALCDPKKGERYFFKPLGRRGSRVPSESLRRQRSVHSSLGRRSSVGSTPAADSSGYPLPPSSPISAPKDNDEEEYEDDPDFEDPEDTSQEGPDESKVVRCKSHSVLEAPDPHHEGRILHLRAKYRSKALLPFEAEARRQESSFRKEINTSAGRHANKRAAAANMASPSPLPVTNRPTSAQGHPPNASSIRSSSAFSRASSSTKPPVAGVRLSNLRGQSNSRPASAASVGTSKTESLQKKKKAQPWVDVTHVDYRYSQVEEKERRSAIHRSHPGLVRDFVKKEIPQYEHMLHDTSLMSYLVGTEQFEAKRKRKTYTLSKEEIKSLEDKYAEDVEVPDPPIVNAGNTHLSLTEEIMARRKREGNVSRDLLKMLFDDEQERLRQEQEERERISEHKRQKSLAAERERRAQERHRRASRIQQEALAQAEEHRRRQIMQTQYAAQHTKERVQSVVYVFEDLLYAERSQQLQRRASLGRRETEETPNNLVIAIPPQYSTLSHELHSLYIGAGFICQPISPATIQKLEQQRLPDESHDDYYQPAEGDEEEDEAMPTREYVLHNDPATISRAKAEAVKYEREVHAMYSEERWGDVDRVKNLMESSGYTLYDAVMNVVKRHTTGAGRASVQVKPLTDLTASN